MNMHYSNFPEFYNHPIIKQLENNKKWTFSDADKRPIDMFELKTFGKIVGAQFTDEKSLMDLNELISLLPEIPNHAYYLDSMTDDIVMLDIESKCPDDIKEKLLMLPYLYGETSLSGQGYHLIFKLPKCISKYPIAQKKIVFKEEHGYYEILLNHWVTFTRNMLPPSTHQNNHFEKLFESMASKQKEVIRSNFNVDTDKPDIPDEDEIISIMNLKPYAKTPEDFNYDTSRFEFGYTGFMNYRMEVVLKIDRFRKHKYTESEKVWLLYEAVKTNIPYRDKHEETRNNMPWLMYIAHEIRSRKGVKQ